VPGVSLAAEINCTHVCEEIRTVLFKYTKVLESQLAFFWFSSNKIIKSVDF